MHSSYDPAAETQVTLPNVVGENAEGQLELHEPGPRVEREESNEVQYDARQGWLRGVPGVRVGATWRRDSAEGEHVSWQQLELRLAGIAKHSGRMWTKRDHQTMRDVELQTWGIVELGDRSLRMPAWFRAPVIDTPCGEVELGRKGKPMRMVQRAMLAWIWLACEAGAGGVWMTNAQWSEALGCSPRSVYDQRKALEERGLIRVQSTWAAASFGKAGPRAGSQDSKNLYRLGPALDAVGLAMFERPHVEAPRGRVNRHAARELAGILRGCAREWGRDYQHSERATRVKWAETSAERRALGDSRAAMVAGVASPTVRSTGGGAERRPTLCAGLAKSANLPAPPSLTGREGELGGSALRAAAGAAHRGRGNAGDHRCSAVAERSPAARSSATAPLDARAQRPTEGAAVPASRDDSTSTTTATLEHDRSTSRRRATAQGAAPRKRTWQDAAAELGRTLGATGNRDAAESVVEALASIGVAVELDPPTLERRTWFDDEAAARVGAMLEPAAAELAGKLGAFVCPHKRGGVDWAGEPPLDPRVLELGRAALEQRAAAAVEALQRERLRDALDGASLFASGNPPGSSCSRAPTIDEPSSSRSSSPPDERTIVDAPSASSSSSSSTKRTTMRPRPAGDDG